MSWLLLVLAIGGDVVGTAVLATAQDHRQGRRNGLVAVWFGVAFVASLVALWAFAQALRVIPTAVADAIYFAGATALLAVVGAVGLGERLGRRKILALVLIVLGVVALRLEAGHG